MDRIEEIAERIADNIFINGCNEGDHVLVKLPNGDTVCYRDRPSIARIVRDELKRQAAKWIN